jgi:arylsulfatase A-like enzyme
MPMPAGAGGPLEARKMFAKKFLALLLLLVIIGCGSQKKSQLTTVRLVSLHPTNQAKRTAAPMANIPKTEFRFDKGLAGWETLAGISNLSVRNGMLVGRTNSERPILHLERKTSKENSDVLHSIEVKLRVSAGTNLRIGFDSAEKFDRDKTKNYVVDFTELLEGTPIIAGSKIQTYSIKPRFAYPASDLRHILLLPTDQKDAEFEIESVRFVFRKEYLATIPSGVSWQGLKGVYHETIVSRSPEVIEYDLTLPQNPWLDLSIGTIEDGPVTFRVAYKGKTGQEKIFEKTVTRPFAWQSAMIPLPGAGRKVTVAFSLSTEKPGMIGFWGSPAVRSRIVAQKQAASNLPQGTILIWTDTLRKDHLDAYGYHRSTAPHVKELAREGILFENCISQATWTKVASPTMFTGLYPTAHGVTEFGDRLPSSAETMAEVFQQAGYATIGFSSNLFTATYSNFHQGFDELHEDRSLPNPNSSKTTRDYMDRLLPWLETHKNVPFFVFLHAYDAHDPYEPYEPYNTMWADSAKKAQHEKELDAARKVIKAPLLRAFGMPNRSEMIEAKINPEEFIAHDEGWYDGSIRGMDVEIGRLMEFLRDSNLENKTMLVFLGDHGEEFLDHERMFHGQSVYGELTNVPFIMRKPGTLPAGMTVHDVVETVDVMPTILELNGLKIPKNVQGQSLTAIFKRNKGSGEAEAAAWKARPAFSMKALTQDNASPPPLETESFAVVLDDWKLIHNTARSEGTPEFELFQQKTDPLNQKNVAAQNPEVVNRLTKIIDEWRTKSAANKLKADSEAAKGLSSEELERMRSLGYIQ